MSSQNATEKEKKNKRNNDNYIKKDFYTTFTHPKSAPRQSPFYAGLRVLDLRSSPATSSKGIRVTAYSFFSKISFIPPNVKKGHRPYILILLFYNKRT